MTLALKNSTQPIISCRIEPSHLLVFTLSAPHRFGVEPFLAEMVSSHLIPGLRFPLDRFRLSCCDGYLEGDIAIQLKPEHISKAKRSLDLFTHELALGLASSVYASQLLELGGGDKRALVQEHLSRLIHRFPKSFGYDLLTVAQHFFLVSSDAFLHERSVRQLGRVITSLYALDKRVSDVERYVGVKIGRATLQEPLFQRQVTTICAAIETKSEHEIINEKDLHQAVLLLVPSARLIKESVMRHKGKRHLFYMEFEGVTGALKGLGNAFARKVTELVPKVSMPRNEEEVMRNLLTLGKELKYLRDLPQVIISFDKQEANALSFTVIVAALDAALSGRFAATSFALEKSRSLGLLRNKHEKHGLLLRVSLPVVPYIEEDGGIDLLRARDDVAQRLQAIVGQFRDFNGGTLAKEAEHRLVLKKTFANQELVGKFFDAISPPQMKSALSLDLLMGCMELLGSLPGSDASVVVGGHTIRVTKDLTTSREGCMAYGLVGPYLFLIL